MDWLTFVSKVIESLAWPSVALVLGLVFRKRLLDLIPAIKKFKAGPLEAEFELAAKQVRTSASAAMPEAATSSEMEGKREVQNETVTRLLNARSDPSGMILEAWGKIEGELFRLGHQLGDVVDPLTSEAKVYQAVIDSNVLPYHTISLVQELRDLRNKVAHVKVTPTSDAAQEYVLAVDRVVDLIHNYRKNLPNYGSTNR